MINVKNIQYVKTAQSCSQLTTKLLQAIALELLPLNLNEFCLIGKSKPAVLKIQAALLQRH